MVPDESRKGSQTGAELVASFQVLQSVGEALNQILEGADASAVRRAIAAIQERFEKCEAILDRLPGGALTRADQEAEIRRLGEELERKRALVRRYGEHDVVSRVLAQRAMPEKDPDAMEDDDAAEEIGDDVMMETDDFGEVGGVDKAVADDMLMGLGI